MVNLGDEEMKDKVTSYEISKRLDELGFECESHCGWWSYSEEYLPHEEEKGFIIDKCSPKAYDCWDLLMWLKENSIFSDADVIDLLYCVKEDNDFYAHHFNGMKKDVAISSQPQDALGLAVIKILEERNND